MGIRLHFVIPRGVFTCVNCQHSIFLLFCWPLASFWRLNPIHCRSLVAFFLPSWSAAFSMLTMFCFAVGSCGPFDGVSKLSEVACMYSLDRIRLHFAILRGVFTCV